MNRGALYKNGYWLLLVVTHFQKTTNLRCWHGSEYTSGTYLELDSLLNEDIMGLFYYCTHIN